jgi:hypothetical protein
VIAFQHRNLFFPIRHRDPQQLINLDTLSSRLVCLTGSEIMYRRGLQLVSESNPSFGLDFQEPRFRILPPPQSNARSCLKATVMPAPSGRCHRQVALFVTMGFCDVCSQLTLLTDTAPPSIPFHNPSQDSFADVSRNTFTNTSEAVQTQQTINLSDFTESLSMADDPFTRYDTFDTFTGQLEDPPPEGDTNTQYNYFDNTLAGNQDPSGY